MIGSIPNSTSVLLALMLAGTGVAAEKSDSPREHWAYVKPQRPAVPVVKDRGWIRNPIDAFVLARLEKKGLAPSPEADKQRLLRRVTLDLIGLPPTIEEIDAFLADESPDAYERAVDRLLASPRYGERWAVPWLDAARYADSNGYQRDGRREYWAYRDWVIRALNEDMPFDRFTIEQIAGDLLPDRDFSQLVATGFHRGTMANVEAGTDPDEERVLAVIDRVNTTGTVWLGTTLECAQCHNHKYDPFSQKEYYGLFAFFNNTEKEIETGGGSRREFVGPKVPLPLTPEQQRRRAELKAQLDGLTKQTETLAEELKPGQAEWEAELAAAGKTKDTKLAANIRQILTTPAGKRTKKQKQALTEFYLSQSKEYKELQDGLKLVRAEYEKTAPPTSLVMKELPQSRTTRVFKRGDFLQPAEPVQPGTPAVLPPLPVGENRDRLTLARWLVDEDNPLVARVTVNRQWLEFFGRGLVETPEDFGTQAEPPTHPELLDWLACEFMSPASHEAPAGFASSRRWSLKHVHRLIVTSATYRQSARVTPEQLARDRYNDLYARGPRSRLKAEFVRDNALAVAGLLSDKIHGPPVFPYQPPGVWNHIGRASNVWTTSEGEDLYRRGLYVYWRRTVPYPSFVSFDAPSREACTVKRSQSNTPLQALTLMNDPAYFEAAAALAARLITEPPAEVSTSERAAYGFRLATSRRPSRREIEILSTRYHSELARYRKDTAAAKKLIAKWKQPTGGDPAEFAAWIHVANVLLNLDEAITK